MFKTLARSVFGAVVCLAMALPAAGQCGDWQFQNPTPQGNRLGGVAFGHGTFVAVGSAGTVLTSPDGVSWTSRLSNTSADLESVAWNGALPSGGSSPSNVRSSVDLPEPLGPTMQVMPGSSCRVVEDAKDLKPLSVRLLRCTSRLRDQNSSYGGEGRPAHYRPGPVTHR